MRKLVLFMHTTLDGFAAGPNGEMDWIHIDDEIFDYAGSRTDNADTGLYGRVTYERRMPIGQLRAIIRTHPNMIFNMPNGITG
jgi:dihydrofolate reductase